MRPALVRRMLRLMFVIATASCYTIATTPKARDDARAAAIAELIGSALLVTAGDLGMRDEGNPEDPSVVELPLALLVGGALLGVAGLTTWSASDPR